MNQSFFLALTFSSMLTLVSLPVTADGQSPDQEVFSGPQAGEPLPKFTVEPLYVEDDSAAIDWAAMAGDRPQLVVFVHEVTRPSVGLTRAVMKYAASLDASAEKETGKAASANSTVATAVVFLTDDMTETRAWASRARRALPQQATLAISPDGAEGPGALGLNRNVTLTVLVAKGDQVLANFALVQPSLQADAYRIVTTVAKAADVEPPSQEAFLRRSGARMRAENARQPNNGKMTRDEQVEAEFARLMRPFVRKDASEAEVEKMATQVEAAADKNASLKSRIGNACRRIVESGRLEQYGNEYSQAYLKQWAEGWRPDR